MNNLDARYAHGDRLSETLNVSQPASFGRNDYSMWNISLDNMKPIFQRLINSFFKNKIFKIPVFQRL